MSELQEVCETLNAINGDILQMARDLHGKAQMYSQAAANAAAAARAAEGQAAAALARTASALGNAARHCSQAATSLVGASREGQDYVQRTVGGSDAGQAAALASAEPGLEDRASAVSLTAADEAALGDYTGTGFVDLNKALWGKSPLTPDIRDRALAVSAAIQKLPVYDSWVHRGVNLSAKEAMMYRDGSYVRHPAFTSSSREKEEMFDRNTYMLVRSRTGRLVGSRSSSPWESEVVFDRNTRFYVRRNYFDETRNRRIILMEEI